MAVISKGGVNALFNQALGRPATKQELDYWTGKDKTKLTTALTTTKGVTKSFKQAYAPATSKAPSQTGTTTTAPPPAPIVPVATPEAPIIEKTKLTSADRERFEKESYFKYLADYGIEIPELAAKYGPLPAGYDPSKTQWGQVQERFGSQEALLGQQYGATLDQLVLDKRQIEGEWMALKKAIETGEIDATSETANAYANNLQAKTQALNDTRRSLSAKGTLFGGVATTSLARAATPFDQRTTQLKNTTQSAYQQAMDQYLGNKKKAQTEFGIDNTSTSQTGDMGYGGGTWDAATQGFKDVKYGLTPQQAQAQGLTFFGTNPYDIVINREAERRRLLSGQMGAIDQNVTNLATDYYNY